MMGYQKSRLVLLFIIGAVITVGGTYAVLSLADSGFVPGGDSANSIGQSPGSEDTADNPWEKNTLIVSVNGSEYMRNSTEEAIRYWEGNMQEYTPYDVSFQIGNSDPDILLKEVDEIGSCGYTVSLSDTLGCAPLINSSSEAPDTAEVRIAGGYGRETTIGTIKHEIGHVLGLSHGDQPTEIMSAETATVPRISGNEVTVRIDYSGDDPDIVRSQVQNTFEYFDRDFEVASNGNADIIFHFDEQGYSCGTSVTVGAGSCGETEDVDDDGVEEYRVSLSGLRLHHIEWHVGVWMSRALGVNSTRYDGDVDYVEIRRQKAQSLDQRSLEKTIHQEVNRLRSENGMSSWNWDRELARIAREKSESMAEAGSLEAGTSFEQRYDEYGYDCEFNKGQYRYFGAENIALRYYMTETTDGTYHNTPEDLAEGVVEGWASRQDPVVLSDVWRNEGIGVDVGSDGAIYITQNIC